MSIRLFLVGVFLTGVIMSPAARAQTTALETEDASGNSLLRLDADAGLTVLGTASAGTVPATGAGVRMMW